MNGPRADSPLATRVALVLLPFAFAAPYIGAFIEDHTGGGTMILGLFFAWLLMGVGAGALGIVCTIIGAWRGPRSWPTRIAIALAGLLCAAVVFVITVFRH